MRSMRPPIAPLVATVAVLLAVAIGRDVLRPAEITTRFRIGAGNSLTVIDRTGWFMRARMIDPDDWPIAAGVRLAIGNPVDRVLRVSWLSASCERDLRTIRVSRAGERLRLEIFDGLPCQEQRRFPARLLTFDVTFDRTVSVETVVGTSAAVRFVGQPPPDG